MPRNRRPYPWPSSKITPEIMRSLHLVSQQTGRPITSIVAQSLQAHMMDAPNPIREPVPTPIGFDCSPAAL